MPYLIQRDKDGQAVQFWSCREGPVTMGRGSEDDGLVDDKEMSRKHFVIGKEGGAYRIKDLGSSNGTFVNGNRVTEATLKSNDRIQAGQTRFDFVDGLTTMAGKIGEDIANLERLSKEQKPPSP
jgi:pSer/pThr/pTyr-binding forkhead associated (FHA) protein